MIEEYEDGNNAINFNKMDGQFDRIDDLSLEFDPDEIEMLMTNTPPKTGDNKMKSYEIEVKAKIGSMIIPKKVNYDEPEDFAEGIEMDGEDKAFKTYLNERKTNFMDKIRREILKDATKKIGELSIDQLRSLGLDI